MKQKYTLVISDVELNVVTDASKEAVEKIVGILDRKMRDINLKSYRCTKNQAALLCALEYCSEKLELQDRNAELEELAEQDAATIAEQENQIAELQAEMKKLQDENEIMHNILERAAASTKRMMGNHEPAAEVTEAHEAAEASEAPEALEAPEMPQAAEEPEAPQAPEVTEALEEPEAPEQLTVDFDEAEQPAVNTKAAQVLEEIADSQTDAPRAKAKAKKAKSRSRVGSMFDLLTFNDV
jgi:cell division protein ZapA (FtsZ GTPase activity inhibitor)